MGENHANRKLCLENTKICHQLGTKNIAQSRKINQLCLENMKTFTTIKTITQSLEQRSA
jgi:hypothetical protein